MRRRKQAYRALLRGHRLRNVLSDSIESSQHVRTIVLDRLDVMNAYDEALLSDVVETIEELEQTSGVRALVLTGAGEAFCAGADLENMPVEPEMDFREYERGLERFQ